MKKKRVVPNKEQLTQAKQWLDDPAVVIPADVKFCLKLLLENMLKGEKNARHAAKGFHELLVKFGFKPSSEKLKTAPPPQFKDAPSQQAVDRLAAEARKKLNAHGDAKKDLSEEMKKLIWKECAARDSEGIELLESFDSIQPEAAQEKAFNDDLTARLESGGEADKSLMACDETLFPAGPVHATSSTVHFTLNKNELEKDFGRAHRSLQKETIHTTRYDFSLQMHCFEVSYETARDLHTHGARLKNIMLKTPSAAMKFSQSCAW